MQFVNFGIDLGTTNSLIARFEKGEVQVFKNPLGHKETLPSVVAFRNDRTLIGDKAKEYVLKDAGNVFSSFKRKMGPNETFPVPSTGTTITPVQLSSMILKELKNFIHTGEVPEAAVITIPASFDTIQSNATKKAGYEAGFKEVLLLQEPVAASLAYFNQTKKEIPEKGNWLVYDLGGGTFDVALVSVVNGELKVIDHEGNNFLGGLDLDTLIIEQLLIPQIVQRTGDASIEEELRNRNGRLEKLFYILLYKAEEAKKELSHQEETEIEFTLPGSDEEMYIRITRNDFNRIIHNKIASTIDLIHSILQRNHLTSQEVNQVIMVGGSTYIPYVRQLVAEQTLIPLVFDADPTTAIVTGAAYYAGSRLRTISETPVAVSTPRTTSQAVSARKLKSVYQSVSSESEELYMAIPEGDFNGLYYRITRDDGGFDSGFKKVDAKIMEFLPLQSLCLNRFDIRFFDSCHNPVEVETSSIEIMQGKLTVAGQPLPNDICLEVDDLENNATKMQVIFERNDILPLKKTIYKEVTRSIAKGSKEELVINVLEGSRHSRAHSNLVIGVIEIKGTDLKSNLLKGSDIEIRFEMSESRDLTITAFLSMTEQEFKNVFSPSEKYVSVSRLKEDVNSLLREMRSELQDERGRDEENDWMHELRSCIRETEQLQARLSKMKETDLTDSKYEISETRRRLSGRYDALGKEQRMLNLQSDYLEQKHFIEERLPFVDLDRDQLMNDFDRIIKDEKQFLRTPSPAILRPKIEALDQLRNRIYTNTKHYIIWFFMQFSSIVPSEYTKPEMARALIKRGEEAMSQDRFEELRTITIALSQLLNGNTKEKEILKIKGTGIG